MASGLGAVAMDSETAGQTCPEPDIGSFHSSCSMLLGDGHDDVDFSLAALVLYDRVAFGATA